MHRHGYFFEDLSLGMSASYSRVIRERDIQQFVDISGDDNPHHLDEDFAAKTSRVKKRIAHGMLSSSNISALIGTKLPGPGCLYVSQTLNFRAPVYIGDEVVTTVTITELKNKNGIITLETICRVAEKVVIDGEAVILVPKRDK